MAAGRRRRRPGTPAPTAPAGRSSTGHGRGPHAPNDEAASVALLTPPHAPARGVRAASPRSRQRCRRWAPGRAERALRAVVEPAVQDGGTATRGSTGPLRWPASAPPGIGAAAGARPGDAAVRPDHPARVGQLGGARRDRRGRHVAAPRRDGRPEPAADARRRRPVVKPLLRLHQVRRHIRVGHLGAERRPARARRRRERGRPARRRDPPRRPRPASYSFTGGPVWRSSTRAHSTVGVAQPDGSVLQRRSGTGSVAVDGDELVITRATALPGRRAGQRRVTTGDRGVRVRDDLTSQVAGRCPLSLSFLLAAPPSAVAGSRTARCVSRWPTARPASPPAVHHGDRPVAAVPAARRGPELAPPPRRARRRSAATSRAAPGLTTQLAAGSSGRNCGDGGPTRSVAATCRHASRADRRRVRLPGRCGHARGERAGAGHHRRGHAGVDGPPSRSGRRSPRGWRRTRASRSAGRWRCGCGRSPTTASARWTSWSAPGRHRAGIGTALAALAGTRCAELGLHTVRAIVAGRARDPARWPTGTGSARPTPAPRRTVDPRTVVPGTGP